MTGCQTTYKPTFCDIVNTDRLQCSPTETAKNQFDLPIIDAIGYRCVSPDDWADGKKKLREFNETVQGFEVTE